jgi:L-lactate dehydrogenase (cytochrome)
MKPASIADLRRMAQRRLPRFVFDFIDGGAGDEGTLAANRADFQRWTLMPRVLVDVSGRSLKTTVLGEEIAMPLILSPTGLSGMTTRRAEVEAAKAARAAGIPYTLSTNASCSIEDVAKEAGGQLWFQLYVMRDRGLTRALLERARDAGYRVLCLTVDLAVQGRRERDIRNGFGIPFRLTPGNMLDVLRRPSWIADVLMGPRLTLANLAHTAAPTASVTELAKLVNSQQDDAVTWRDLEWMREIWPGPIALKGVVLPEDARRAVELGCAGVIVSNHGGRQLDAGISAIAALPAVVEAVEGRAEVLLDGGVRRGADILKAVALGARACMIGRPFLYGLAALGPGGAAAAIELFRAELDNAMALIGRSAIAEIDRTLLQPSGA